uniref:Myosin heavy chain fast skeletal muscle embryonic n=1 Tax=Rhizophora mucronata TaxID=61149 RepID=A0A2P2J532_RHIMU
MDSRIWTRRKKSSEKTIVATNMFDILVKGTNEQGQKCHVGNEVGPVRPVRNLNEKLASALLDCQDKDNSAPNHQILVHEAIPGQEKVEMEAVCLRKELDEVQRQLVVVNERLIQSEAALKQCKQQLSFLQEEQEQKILDALMKASSENEKIQKELEDRLLEISRRYANLAVENTNLSNALLVKENLVEELHQRATQTVAEFNALMARLDSTEKDNTLLKYEFLMLEKELEVHNEELEYNRQFAEASQKQQLENAKKTAKLEAECQRLRILMQKRLPGPAALSKMKSEVRMLGRDPLELRRKPNPTRDLIFRDTRMERSPEIPVENINFLIEHLRNMEEENRELRETLTKKNAELQSSRIMFSQTASRLSQAEAQLIVHSGGQKSLELVKCNPASHELSPKAVSDICNADGVSSSGSCANALISELENFRGRKLWSPTECKATGFSDMSLMDDFAEMEKLAIVSVQVSSEGENRPFPAGNEIVPVAKDSSGCGNEKQDIHSKGVANDQPFDWLQEVLNAMLRQQRISKRSLIELLEDIKIALGYINHPNAHEDDTMSISKHLTESNVSGCLIWKSMDNTSAIGSLNEASCNDITVKKTGEQCSQSSISKSICRIIQLIKGVSPTSSLTNDSTEEGLKSNQNSLCSPTKSDYYVHVFQWRKSELNAVLQQFLRTCNGVLNGKAGLETFAEELSFTLDWIMTNYVNPKGARDKIRKHFGWDDTQGENEVGSASKTECIQSNLQEDIKSLENELMDMESAKKDTEDRLQSATDKTKDLMMQLEKAEESIKSLRAEVGTLKESKGLIEDQIENQKSINEDLDTQLTVARSKLNEVLQRFSWLEVELEDKSNCYEELEATCLDLQLQLER